MDAASIRRLKPKLFKYLGEYGDCSGRSDTRGHLTTYVEGQLSKLDRKSVEPITLVPIVPLDDHPRGGDPLLGQPSLVVVGVGVRAIRVETILRAGHVARRTVAGGRRVDHAGQPMRRIVGIGAFNDQVGRAACQRLVARELVEVEDWQALGDERKKTGASDVPLPHWLRTDGQGQLTIAPVVVRGPTGQSGCHSRD